jgi:epoxyqueuosine reductase
MGYLASGRSRQRRADPRQILPECQSILVLGVPYSPAGELVGRKPGRGRLAAYAWGLDYHEVLRPRLQALAAFVAEQAGEPVPCRWYSDSGPVLERDLAQRAGLGWIGKNTCLIHPERGSYFLLAEILLGIALEVDEPFVQDRCGSCRRCLEACPTGCILPDRTIDARRCIAYLTIEHKGVIPRELRELVGDWVFGCDICQQACPWNRRFAASQPPDRELAPIPGRAESALVEDLALTAEDFNRRFKGSAVKRAKRRGYLRNITIALGNQAKREIVPETIPALVRALQADPEALVRGYAAWALGRLGGESAIRALAEALQTESDDGVRAEIAWALGER